MRWIKVFVVFVMAVTLLFSGTLAYLTITDSDFEGSVTLSVTNNQVSEIPIGESIGITTINIGYGGWTKHSRPILRVENWEEVLIKRIFK